MLELKDRQRKTIKVLLIFSVVASVYFGLKGVFIDLYNPGSPVARQYSDYVNYMFMGTLVISIPLLIEKFQRLSKWHDRFDKLTHEEQKAALWGAAKPLLKQGVFVVVLIIVASVLLTWYWQIPPDVVANYKSYYSPKGIGSFNINASNNITVINMILKR